MAIFSHLFSEFSLQKPIYEINDRTQAKIQGISEDRDYFQETPFLVVQQFLLERASFSDWNCIEAQRKCYQLKELPLTPVF